MTLSEPPNLMVWLLHQHAARILAWALGLIWYSGWSLRRSQIFRIPSMPPASTCFSRIRMQFTVLWLDLYSLCGKATRKSHSFKYPSS